MPRYFFHLANGEDVRDPDGDFLRSDTEARRMALAIMAETIATRADHLVEGGRYMVETTDERGRVVGRLTLTADNG